MPTKAQTTIVTPKQEKFLLKYIETDNKTEAYKYAYDTTNYKEGSIYTCASRLLKNVKVMSRYQELLKENEKDLYLSIKDKRKHLKNVVKNKESREDYKLKAIDLDNKMAGVYVENHKVDVNEVIHIKVSIV